MRTYVIVTGVIFALIVLAHVARIFMEPSSTSDPYFLVSTVVFSGLALWSWRALRQPGS